MIRSIHFWLGLLISVTLFAACGEKQNDMQEVLKRAKPLQTNNMAIDFLLGKPNQITICDNILIISDNIEGKSIALYDIKDRTFKGRQLSVGQGPNEVIPPLLLPRSNEIDHLSVMQRQNGRYTEYAISLLTNGGSIPLRSLELKNTDRLAQTGSGFITSGPYEEGSIRILDSLGKLSSIQNIYPKHIRDLKNYSDRYVYGQGHIVHNNRNNILAFASYFIGDVAFYKVTENSLDRLNYYDFSLSSELHNRIVNATETASLKPTDIEYFSDIYATPDHFYLLYTGVPMKDKNSVSHSYILKYSSSGELIDSYQTDKKIISFCVHKEDKKIYAIALSEEMEYLLVEMNIT